MVKVVRFRRYLGLLALASTAIVPLALTPRPAFAVTIEIDDVAPDRVERQRAYAEGALPLPGTPDLGHLKERLAAAGVKFGDEMFVRIFKAESELEIWIRKGPQFTLFATYPICHWAGTIGPKLREGDKQNPEGFYSIGPRQLHRAGRWPRSLDIGFPNSYDKAMGRTGSYILVHGGCSSVGCYAMTNAVMAEVFALTEEALRLGQPRMPLHVFPFRMSDANMARHSASPWLEFWRDLKEGYDAFEATHVPPRIGLCDKRYSVEKVAPEEVGATSPLVSCGASRAAAVEVEPSPESLAELPALWPLQEPVLPLIDPNDPLAMDREQIRRLAMRLQRSPRFPRSMPIDNLQLANMRFMSSLRNLPSSTTGSRGVTAPICNPGLASCRRYLALSAELEAHKARSRGQVASRSTGRGGARSR